MHPSRVFQVATAKTLNLDNTPGGVRVNPHETFAQLKGLNEMAYNFGLAKYSLDQVAADTLYYLLKPISEKIAKENKWKFMKKETLHRTIILALDMHLYPQLQYCRRCQGSGSSSMGGCV